MQTTTETKPFAELTKEYRRLMDAPNSEEGRFAMMALCKAMSEHPVSYRDPLMAESIRGWIGKIQAKFGFQEFEKITARKRGR